MGSGPREMLASQDLTLPSDSVSFCPNEQQAGLLAVSSSDFAGEVWTGELCFFELAEDATLSRQATYKSTSGIAGCTWVGDDQTTVLTGHDDGSLTLYTKEGEKSKISTPHHNVLCVGAEAGSPSTALTGGTDRSVRVWDLNTSKQLSALEGHSSKVESVASNDPNVLVSGSSEGIVLLWDKRQESEPTLIEVEGGRCSINSLSWMDGGSSQQFVVGCDSSDVLLFDLRQLGEPSSRLKGHTSSVTSVSASQYAVSAGLVVSCGSDNKVCIFDPTAETPQAVGNKSLCGHVDTPQAVAWHPTRKIVASVGYDCKLICHDLVATVTE